SSTPSSKLIIKPHATSIGGSGRAAWTRPHGTTAERGDVDRVADRVRALLGRDAFAAEYARGEADPGAASPAGQDAVSA
ncbi:hypothetical protein AB0K34_42180, partial [Actinomadura sp. NPDC049382]|uniref:hypothetical protein n=1 Tax=Actinomadura sp. NPDC049382 TaxID=3158220 RepID=UPI00343A4589